MNITEDTKTLWKYKITLTPHTAVLPSMNEFLSACVTFQEIPLLGPLPSCLPKTPVGGPKLPFCLRTTDTRRLGTLITLIIRMVRNWFILLYFINFTILNWIFNDNLFNRPPSWLLMYIEYPSNIHPSFNAVAEKRKDELYDRVMSNFYSSFLNYSVGDKINCRYKSNLKG